MERSIPITLLVTGLALFALGDLLWLVRNTFKRPMDMRLTGGLVGVGVALTISMRGTT